MTDDGEPFKAGVYASFDGFVAVPEPATWAILVMGSGRGRWSRAGEPRGPGDHRRGDLVDRRRRRAGAETGHRVIHKICPAEWCGRDDLGREPRRRLRTRYRESPTPPLT